MFCQWMGLGKRCKGRGPGWGRGLGHVEGRLRLVTMAVLFTKWPRGVVSSCLSLLL